MFVGKKRKNMKKKAAPRSTPPVSCFLEFRFVFLTFKRYLSGTLEAGAGVHLSACTMHMHWKRLSRRPPSDLKLLPLSWKPSRFLVDKMRWDEMSVSESIRPVSQKGENNGATKLSLPLMVLLVLLQCRNKRKPEACSPANDWMCCDLKRMSWCCCTPRTL
jgi:hypothetical protein